jgi:hypothetical protein
MCSDLTYLMDSDCCPTTCVPSTYNCPDGLFEHHCQSSMPTSQPSGAPTQLTEIVQVSRMSTAVVLHYRLCQLFPHLPCSLLFCALLLTGP